MRQGSPTDGGEAICHAWSHRYFASDRGDDFALEAHHRHNVICSVARRGKVIRDIVACDWLPLDRRCGFNVARSNDLDFAYRAYSHDAAWQSDDYHRSSREIDHSMTVSDQRAELIDNCWRADYRRRRIVVVTTIRQLSPRHAGMSSLDVKRFLASRREIGS